MRPARRFVWLSIVAVALAACSATTPPSGSVAAPVAPSSLAPRPPKPSRPPKPKAKPSKHHSMPSKPKPKPSRKPHPAGVPAADLPNPNLTPGGAFHVGLHRICVSGYSASVRDVPEAEKRQAYDRYGIAWVPYQHEVDHLVSLEIGGSNAIGNLWPEPYAGRWGARTKDVLEDRLHELVCERQLSLRAAQHQEATNWVAAYRRYVGAPPSGVGPVGVGNGAGGFYASSYPSASTIYCADDPEWRNLSKTYLRHFATYAQAKATFPGYHLHRPC